MKTVGARVAAFATRVRSSSASGWRRACRATSAARDYTRNAASNLLSRARPPVLLGILDAGTHIAIRSARRLVSALEARSNDFVPLRDAAQELFDLVADKPLGGLAREYRYELRIDPLMWIAYWMDERGLPIYGRHSASTIMERVSIGHSLSEDLSSVGEERRRDRVEFSGLAVRRREFGRMLPALTKAPTAGPLLRP